MEIVEFVSKKRGYTNLVHQTEDSFVYQRDKKYLFIFIFNNQIGSSHLRFLLYKLQEYTKEYDILLSTNKQCVIIIDNSHIDINKIASNEAKKNIEYLKLSHNMWVDVFTNKQLLVLSKNHVLVPHHELCSAKEKEQVLREFNVTPELLPEIKIDDPQAILLEARVGDLIKIIRSSPTQVNDSLYYRYVTE